MRISTTAEELTREISVPDQPHKGVKFSSPAHGSTEVTLDFTRWADMRYPNKIRVDITPVQYVPRST